MSTISNTQTVTEFYTRAFNDGEPESAAATALGDTYVQHNPSAPDGAAAFISYVHSMRQKFPGLHVSVRRTVSEGDYVVTHSEFHLGPGDRGMAVADIWRLSEGKIVEHWDVMHPVPEQAANTNSMF